MSAAVVIMPAILLTGTRATGFDVVPLLKPTVAIIMATCVMQATQHFFRSIGGVFPPDIVPLLLKQFSNRWLVF